jgi:hypothetical protein
MAADALALAIWREAHAVVATRKRVRKYRARMDPAVRREVGLNYVRKHRAKRQQEMTT